MKDNQERYGKCPECDKYTIHVFNSFGRNKLYGDKHDALDELSEYFNSVYGIDDFWAYVCVECGHVTAMGFSNKSFIPNNETDNSLMLAIENDELKQALIDLHSRHPEDTELILKNYGIKL